VPDFVIEHRPGARRGTADPLSRRRGVQRGCSAPPDPDIVTVDAVEVKENEERPAEGDLSGTAVNHRRPAEGEPTLDNVGGRHIDVSGASDAYISECTAEASITGGDTEELGCAHYSSDEVHMSSTREIDAMPTTAISTFLRR
jgi:hypothetical protein